MSFELVHKLNQRQKLQNEMSIPRLAIFIGHSHPLFFVLQKHKLISTALDVKTSLVHLITQALQRQRFLTLFYISLENKLILPRISSTENIPF